MDRNHDREEIGGDLVDWLALFEQEKVQYAILDRRADSELLRMLRRQCGWSIDMEDRGSVILVRNDMGQQSIKQE